MTGGRIETLPLRSIGAQIAERLEAAIIREEFAPGEKLREEAICAQFGVSRSPLREALQLLEPTGLIERRPRLGARVTEISVAGLDELTQCRMPLEATAAGLVARQPDHAVIADALQAEVARMEAARDPREAFEANVRLTGLLHSACGNALLLRLLAQVDKLALRYRFRAYRSDDAILGRMSTENQLLVEAVRAGDAERAEAVTVELIRRAWETTRAVLERSGA
ncbi:GntR family transcriptional regulator [Mangrovicoccus sp. HB161399]|uniref:GntR family transcriptional regulator n=1 Tax=Mangrovicoccus sp. HB161399 TaxID=2720392 RepID=UPI0015574509|nr:GntR family transcriptional regulator [Mangrovicoccus sp. HB161399]